MMTSRMKKKTDTISIQERVDGFKTKHKSGFVKSEIEELLKSYPKIDMEKFNNAMIGITCSGIDGEIIIYHCDVEKAIRCGIEKRSLRTHEWD